MIKRPKHTLQAKPKQTSWESVGKWYHGVVGEDGHYYHQNVVLPGVLTLFDLKNSNNPSILDIACGQGVLARNIPENIPYTGIDLSSTLIKAAKASDKNPIHEYAIADVSKCMALKKKDFSHAAIILALQNIEEGATTLRNVWEHLRQDGKLVIVLNHPCFRIPRQSSWGIDESKKIQYRRVDRYYNDLKIPIAAHPSKGETSPSTWSFHHPLSSYSKWLHEAGFHIDLIEEWCSNKESTGKNAKMENRSREEIPMFMAILAVKRPQS